MDDPHPCVLKLASYSVRCESSIPVTEALLIEVGAYEDWFVPVLRPEVAGRRRV